MQLIYVLAILISCTFRKVESWRPGKPLSLVREGAQTPLPAGYTYKTLYFDQKIDHLGFDNDATFKQRYLVADQFWNRNGGPIFFYTGNEGDIDWFCNNTGFMWDIAPDFKAMLVFAEHRYYGKSLPYGSQTFKNHTNLNYLTSEQALADFAELIRYLKATIPGAANSKVVAFGGSYGGMLAAWFRIKYPNMVVGALAASAPVWGFSKIVNCGDFLDIVTHDFNATHPQCMANIKEGWYTISATASGMAGGYEFLTNTFKLCTPLKSKYDLDPFMSMLADTYVNLAEVNYPYKADFLAELPAWPVEEACKPLSTLYEGKELLVKLATITNLYYNYTGNTPCINWTDSGSTGSLGYAGWDYQSCTEMVMPICSNGSNMFYNMPWDFSSFSDGCYQKYKTRPRQDWISLEYWGKQLTAASNIILSNGLYDPWSSGGVLQSISDTVVAIQVPYGAHHYDLRAKNPQDTPSVKSAREQETNIIHNWLGLTSV